MKDLQLENLKNEELAELYDNLREDESNIKVEKKFVGEEVLNRLKHSGEVWGHYSISKRVLKTIVLSDNEDEELRIAKELGATKEVVDQSKLKALMNKGVKLPGKIVEIESPIVKFLERNTE